MNACCGNMAREHATGSDLEFESFAPSIKAIAEMLRACVRADACLIAIERSGGEGGQLYGTHERPSERESAASQATQALLNLPAEPVLFNGPPVPGLATGRAAATVAAVADLTQVSSFISLPLRVAVLNGRICIASEQGRFTSVDLVNLTRLAEQVGAVMESIYRGERLAVDLARHARRQISRDLHDSAIQPIIALKLGLEALRRRLAEEKQLAKDLDDLIAIAGAGIGELRQYVGALRAASTSGSADGLAAAVRCQAKKFSALYGIEATVIASGDLSISAPMQHELIQIIREGLSNIRRHTAANRAAIHIRQRDGKLLLEMINDNGGQKRTRRRFLPRSICERAKELGGRVRVNRGNRYTVVAVDLPI
jgi:signal transduction histidine kinase